MRGCLSGCFGLLLLAVLAGALAGLWLYGRVTGGPSFDGDAFSVDGRRIPVSDAAAARFDEKVAAFVQGLAGGRPQLLELTEEEVNSRLAAELARLRAQDPDLPVEWALVELQDGRAVAHARVRAMGVSTTASAPLHLSVAGGRPEVEVGALRVANLPPVPGVSDLAANALEEAGIDRILEEQLPPALDELRVEEGRVVAAAAP